MAKANGSAYSNFMPNFDMSAYMPDISSMKMPAFGFDVNAMMQAQRRAAETMTQIGQKSMECAQHLMQRQGEMVRESLSEGAQIMSEVMAAGTPEEKMAKQSELTKAAIEKAIANSRELVEMLTEANRETAEMFSSHVSQTMNEMRVTAPRGQA